MEHDDVHKRARPRFRLHHLVWTMLATTMAVTIVLSLVTLGAVRNLKTATVDGERWIEADRALDDLSNTVVALVSYGQRLTPHTNITGPNHDDLYALIMRSSDQLRVSLSPPGTSGPDPEVAELIDNLEQAGLEVVDDTIDANRAASAGDSVQLAWQNRLLTSEHKVFQLHHTKMRDATSELRNTEFQQLVEQGESSLRQVTLTAGPLALIVLGMLWLVPRIRRREDALKDSLRHEQTRLQAIVDCLPVGVSWKDRDHRILGANTKLLSAVAPMAITDPIGSKISDLDHDKRAGWLEWERLEAEAMERSRTCNSEFVMQVADETRIIRYSCSPLVFDGEMIGVVTASEDITEARRVESALSDTRRMESIGQLAAGIAHEINTPVQFVSDNTEFLSTSFADMLSTIENLEGICRPDHGEELDRVLHEADLAFLREEVPGALSESLDGLSRVSEIVRAMNDFSHPGVGLEDRDLNRLINSAVTVARNEWKYVAELHLDLADDLPLIRCREGQIKQVLLNLIINAAHAIGEARPDGGKGNLTISTSVAGHAARIRVSDDGIGMTPEIKERIFDRFFTTKEVGRGTGQGLAVTWEVVAAHDGRIDVESTPDGGSTFIIDLPLMVTAAVQV